MQTFEDVIGRRAARRLRVVALVTFATPIVFGLLAAPPSCAQSQTASVPARQFTYEVVSIKPDKSGPGSRAQIAPDGYSEKYVTLKGLILRAFGLQEFQLSGATGWVESERFDIDARMDTATADALQKLDVDDQRTARQQMLQAVLADRFQLTFHRESKVFQVYSLVVAKNGSKLHEAKPGDTYPNGIKYPNGGGGAGATMMRLGPTSHTLTAQAAPISSLLNALRAESMERPLLDKTGLTGKYDFTLTWAPENVSVAVPGGAASSQGVPGDPAAPSLFVALEEQLGLKLESGKAPIEIIVIDRAERPSGN
jgi:bla regulator protein blaR1